MTPTKPDPFLSFSTTGLGKAPITGNEATHHAPAPLYGHSTFSEKRGHCSQEDMAAVPVTTMS